MNQQPASFEPAAAETLNRIRRDLATAPPRLKPILSYIESHLYEPGLDFQQLRIACKIRDNTVPIEFHSEIGMPPYTYIKHCRLETAARLLRDTELKVWQICMLVGYSGIQVFSRAFLEWSGLRPTAYRRKQLHQSAQGREGTDKSTWSATPPTSALLRRAVQGKLEPGQADHLIRQLHRLYPRCEAGGRQTTGKTSAAPANPMIREPLSAIPDGLMLEIPTIETLRAEEIWRSIADLSPIEQRIHLRTTVRLSSAAFFDFLCQKSLALGRDNRQRGVTLAKLALFSLELLNREDPEIDRRALTVRAWSRLGNAHRLALDFLQAEKAFLKAEHYLPEGEAGDHPEVSEFLAMKATLRWYQSRYQEALQLINQALVLGRRIQLDTLLVQILVMKSAILQQTDQAETGLECLLEARQLVDSLDNPLLKLSVHQSLAFLMTLKGEFTHAATMLPSLRVSCEQLGIRPISLKLVWVEGLIAQGLGHLKEAEKLFREARAGFIDLDLSELTAVVTLDLALLCARQGRSNEVTWLVTEIIPIFDALQHRETAMIALKLLQNALDNRNVTAVSLEQSRATLVRLQWEPGLTT